MGDFNASDYGQLSKSEIARQEGRSAALFTPREAEIASIIRQELGEDVSNRDQRLCDDLKADSLDIVEIVIALEDHFKIEISDDESAEIKTVEDVFNVVKTALAHEDDASIRPVRS